VTDRLIWVDIETTGLDVRKEVILEIGFRITDLNLDELASFHALVWTQRTADTIEAAVPYVFEMHEKNGLFKQVATFGHDEADTADRLASWVDQMGVETTEPLCGSSVQFDREWLTYLFPESMEKFSYRNIDISSVKELCRRYNPKLYAKLEEDIKPQKYHRVHPDLTDTIEEFKFYRDEFLWWEGTKVA